MPNFVCVLKELNLEVPFTYFLDLLSEIPNIFSIKKIFQGELKMHTLPFKSLTVLRTNKQYSLGGICKTKVLDFWWSLKSCLFWRMVGEERKSRPISKLCYVSKFGT